MRLAAVGGLSSVLALIFGNEPVRGAAQVQLVHAMATFVCATVMNIGGRRARWAPGCFLAGALVFCGAGYALAGGAPAWVGVLRWPGLGLLVCGWGVLAWAAGEVDRPLRPSIGPEATQATARTPRRRQREPV